MELLDEEGRLFGIVNIIDALAILLLVSVLVAGAAVIGDFGDTGEPETRYATVELSQNSPAVLSRLAVGDQRAASPQTGNVTLTDVYLTADGQANVTGYVRVEIEGTLLPREAQSGQVFGYAGEPLRIGDMLTIGGADYSVEGRLISIENESDLLPTQTTAVRIETAVSRPVANSLTEGDEYRVAGRSIATLRDVQTYPHQDAETRRVSLGLELETIQLAGTTSFAGRPISLDSEIPFKTAEYRLNGQIVQRGTTSPPGDVSMTTATINLTGVHPAVANKLQPGQRETLRGQTLVTITNVTRRNATVVLESESGNIYARDHPVLEDVSLEVKLRTRRTASGLEFHGQPLTVGRTVTLDFGTVELRGTVTGTEE
jgi:hypothetical protein